MDRVSLSHRGSVIMRKKSPDGEDPSGWCYQREILKYGKKIGQDTEEDA